jgi:hypothetical protein
MKLRYEVQVRSPRELVDKVVYPFDSSILMRTIYDLRPNSLAQPPQPYYLEDLIAERQRLSDTLRNHGWYYFSPDNLLFEADTLHPPGDMNLTLRVKKEVGEREKQRYRVASVTVYPDYDLARKTDSTQAPNRHFALWLRAICLSPKPAHQTRGVEQTDFPALWRILLQ